MNFVKENTILFAIISPLFYYVRSVSPNIFVFSKKHRLNFKPLDPILIEIVWILVFELVKNKVLLKK